MCVHGVTWKSEHCHLLTAIIMQWEKEQKFLEFERVVNSIRVFIFKDKNEGIYILNTSY